MRILFSHLTPPFSSYSTRHMRAMQTKDAIGITYAHFKSLCYHEPYVRVHLRPRPPAYIRSTQMVFSSFDKPWSLRLEGDFIRLFTFFIYFFIHLSIYLSIHLSIYLSIVINFCVRILSAMGFIMYS